MVAASVVLVGIAITIIISKIKEAGSATVDEDGNISTTTEASGS